MRMAMVLGLAAAMTIQAGAARRVTVAQVEQELAQESDAHRADADIARKIGELELSERLTGVTLDHLAAKLPLGPRTALALQLLADQSAFLDPPASELPATVAPDAATEERMMDMARGYVVQAWPHLPDFFLTRTTARFEDSPQVLKPGDWPVRAGMHLAATSTRDVTYRDGVEARDSAMETAAVKASAATGNAAPEQGLSTKGEFGPEMTIVLADSAKGKVTWSHWEATPAGLAAVYRYTVPRAASHFSVDYCCLLDEPMGGPMGMGAGGGRRGSAGRPFAVAGALTKHFTDTPGYHGSLFVSPSTGAILRITLEAELKDGDPLARAATVVEYGPVSIGNRHYMFPVRSLAFSMEQVNNIGRPGAVPVLRINETSFTHYHRLGSWVRVLAEGEAPSAANAATTNSVPLDSTAFAPAPSGQGIQPAVSEAIAGEPATTKILAEAAAPATPAEPAVAEISVTAASGVPDQPIDAAQAQEGGFQLKVASRLVDVGVVVYDKKGDAVKDLKAEDFEVYDNGHKQEIGFFSQMGSGTAPAAGAAETAAERTFSNRSADAAAGGARPSGNGAAEAGATVLLIDESHIAWADLSHARQEMLKFLDTVAAGERIGIYTMTGLGFRVLEEITTDHAALTAKLKGWMPTAQSVSQAQEEETRNRQSFNEVHSVADLNSVNGNQTDVPDAQSTVDPQLRTFGSNPARASLMILGGVARHLSAVAGHKNLVWVSSDNVFADWQSNQVGIDKSPKVVDSFALHAQEAMNDAHVAVFPMDVSQLEGAGIGADIQHRNVELTQAAADTAVLGGGSVANNRAPGRITAEMQQDLHPIQGPIRQVADSTGGRIIRRSGDLAAALAGVVEDGHATYLLSFYPQGPADDQYHTISVKLTGKQHGLTPRYRTGYLFAKEPATLKDRFQQAVWRPSDTSEVAVTAGVTPTNSGATVKIEIAAADLGLRQQADRWIDKLDIFFIERDDEGIHAQVEGQTLGLRLKSSTYQNLISGGVPFEHFVQMKPGMASLRVLVVDENSSRMGTVTVPGTALEAGH